MAEQAEDAGRLICKIGPNGYVRQRGEWIDISEDGMSGATYKRVNAERERLADCYSDAMEFLKERGLLDDFGAWLSGPLPEAE